LAFSVLIIGSCADILHECEFVIFIHQTSMSQSVKVADSFRILW